jgi:hypothetical protein
MLVFSVFLCWRILLSSRRQGEQASRKQGNDSHQFHKEILHFIADGRFDTPVRW